jgi:hypothetical protein
MERGVLALAPKKYLQGCSKFERLVDRLNGRRHYGMMDRPVTISLSASAIHWLLSACTPSQEEREKSSLDQI